MYAVIKTGGKQHKVQAGDVIEVEKLVGADETVTFTPLLVVDDDGKTHAGPAASKATVTAKPRSEEHTSELQSRLHLVCRLLLEKKKHAATKQPYAPARLNA